MPEYVYALHDFVPEHEDEINFKAGDRIEVIEKDDLYGDGWWQGRNLSGKVGLFPQSYTATTPANQATVSVPDVHTPKLQPLQEESPEDVAALATPEPKTATLHAQPPSQADGSPSNNIDTPAATNGTTVMSATLTDVQRAIEQLAARRDTDDATSRSFSFASTNHDTDTESEADHHEGDGDEQHQWHRDARRALAERAQMENARREREEAEALRVPPPHPLLDVPAIPIAAELSDESDTEEGEDEEDEDRERSRNAHTDATVVPQPLPSLVAPIPEPAQPAAQPLLTVLTAQTIPEDVHESVQSSSPAPAASITPSTSTSTAVAANIPLPKTPGATSTFAIHTPPPLPPNQIQIQNLSIQTPIPSTAAPLSPSASAIAQTPLSAATITPYTTATDLSSTSTPPPPPSLPMPMSMPVPVPSPSPAQIPDFQPQRTSTPPIQVSSQQSQPQPVSPPARPSSPPPPSVQSSFKQIHPSEWTVDQVVEWLKSKGIDESTCSKFIEHEITGDVLLELDASMLKDEMGITALGKRMRIQNGIVELKRPVSANLNNLPMPMPTSASSPLPMPMNVNMSMSGSVSSASSFVQGQGQTPGQGMGVPNMAAVQQQQMYNFSGIPVPGSGSGAQMPQPAGLLGVGYATGPGPGAGQTQAQGQGQGQGQGLVMSTSTPALSTSFQGYSYPNAGNGRTPSIESPLTMVGTGTGTGTGSPYAGSIVSEEFNNNNNNNLNNGVGKEGLPLSKPRPAYLKFSPSDGALGNGGGGTGVAIELSPTQDGDDKDEDKGVQSEPETALHPALSVSSKKRRLFGLSTESGGSSSISGGRRSNDSRDKPSAPATPRSGSIRIGAGVFGGGGGGGGSGSGLRSRSPTPVGVATAARRSGESGSLKAADDSLVVVSNVPSPASSPSHLGVAVGRHARSKKSFDGGLAGVFGRDKEKDEKKEKEREEKREREREREERKGRGAGDRTSFFGNGMSLGRSRKPAPRYSLYEADAAASGGVTGTTPADKHRSISRYIIGFGSISSGGGSGTGGTVGGGGGGGGKKKSSRPGTAPSGNGIKPIPFGQQQSDAAASPSDSASPSTPVKTTHVSTASTSGVFSFGTKDDTHIVRSSSPSGVSHTTGSVLRKRHLSTTGPGSPPLLTTRNSSNGNGATSASAASSGGNGSGKQKASPLGASTKADKVDFQVGLSVLEQIGQPDYAGWLKKKGEKYNAWKTRYLVLKGPHLYYLKDADKTATKIKGYVKVQGYKIVTDESGPGKYGFKIVHETEPTHYFCSDELLTTREWMKALMKATIERDYSKPVISSCNIPTIPLVVAQTMNPGPRPPSPTARDATQRASRRENPNQLSTRDARVLMGLPSTTTTSNTATNEGKSNGNSKSAADGDTFFMEQPLSPPPPLTPSAADEEATLVNLASSLSVGGGSVNPPKRPSRDARTPHSSNSVNSGSKQQQQQQYSHSVNNSIASGVVSVDNIQASDLELVDWANSLLPAQYKITDITTDLSSGLVLFRLAETIRGRPSEPPVPDSVFNGENSLDGMFKLFDFLWDNEVKMGSVSINDIKFGRWDKIVQLMKALRVWGEKRKTIARSIGKGLGQTGPWITMDSA